MSNKIIWNYSLEALPCQGSGTAMLKSLSATRQTWCQENRISSIKKNPQFQWCNLGAYMCTVHVHNQLDHG
jgi:hypothetical protein